MIKKSGTVFIFLVSLGVFAVLLFPKVMNIRKLESRSESLEKELTKVKSENKALEDELHLLRDDPVYLEKVAREKFNKAKQGEIVYKIVREGDEVKKK